MRRLLFFVTAILLTSNSFSQIDPETDCPAPETFLVGEYQIADVTAVVGPGNGTSNFEPGLVNITGFGNTRTFQNGILPAFNVEIETINLRLNCSVIQIEDVNPSLQCNGVDAYLFTTTDEAGSTPYSLIDGDASFIINYIEDPLGSCGGPFISSFSLTKTCSAPQSLSFSNATDTTVDLNWEDTNNASTSTNTYTIEYGPQGFTPGNGQILTDIPVNSATVTNLQTNTAYDFYIFGSCSGSTSPVTGPFGYGNFVNPDFILDANGLTCLCPDADFGEEGTLLTNEGLKTFTKRTESELRALVDVNEFDPQIALTCTSGITNMSSLFDNKFSFNQSLEHWDVSNVTDMNFMFNNAGTFNQLLNMWDVSNVTNMSRMFSTASSFNQPLNNWDVSSVTDMSFMFIFVNVFNQPLNDWDVSNVTNMEQMFPGTSFNQPLDNWDVSQVTDMFAMFTQTPFNQPINNWDVSNVTDFGIMFRDTSYNLPLNNWDVSSATSLSGMFSNNPSFNQPLDNWNVSNAISLSRMFANNPSFNQPLDNWDVSNVTSMNNMFETSTAFNQDISVWDVSQVTNMSGMFQDATVFNQDISVWDVSQVTIMSRMFQGAAVFNQDISVWDVSQVTNMFSMFADAFDFNQPLDNWDVSNVTSMNNMFETSTAFNQDLSSWVFNPTANLTNFLSGSGLDTDNYDALLQSFDNQNLIGLALGADGVFYCDETTRNNLINDKNWTISGDSLGQCGITLNPSTTPFVTTWTVANPDLSIDIFTVDAWDYDFSVDWGDGTTDTNVTSTITHIYANPGTYTVSINGIFPYFKTCDILFGFANCTNSPKLTSVESWGDQEWRVMLGSFRKASNFNINTTAAPNISNVTSLEKTFLDAFSFNQNINNWDVSQVTDMTGTFREASSFNQPLDNWDVSQVRTMEYAFFSASSFNQNINNWDVSSVTNMRSMFGTFGFLTSHAFNQPLNTWDVSQVTDMFAMFVNASDFNQSLNDWDVGNVTNMSSMFGNASDFNQALNDWDVGNVTNMSGMFGSADNFNQTLNNWDVSNVTNMSGMFQYATVFNQDISVWDVSQVTNMSRMFLGAAVFNQDISVWDVSQVTNMFSMFADAFDFNQALNNWNTSNVTSMSNMFVNASSYNQPMDMWDVSQVTGMFQMFQGAAVFNQDLSIWCVEQIAEEPFDFATNSALQIDFFPDWGGVCDPLSVNEENLVSFKIYPNPVNDWLTIDLGNQTNAKITVYDISGKRILSQDITSNIHVLDVNNLQSGMYLMTINSEGKTTTQRFLKQ